MEIVLKFNSVPFASDNKMPKYLICSVSEWYSTKLWFCGLNDPILDHRVYVAIIVLTPPHRDVGWSAVCDCGNSWSYLLTFLHQLT